MFRNDESPESVDANSRDPAHAIAPLADALRATVLLAESRGRTTRVMAHVVRDRPIPDLPATREIVRQAPASPTIGPALVTAAGSAWTVVQVPAARRRTTLIVHGDWTGAAIVAATATRVSALLADQYAAHRRRSELAAYRLGRTLARVSGFPRICDLVAATAARALDATVVSVAVFDPIEQVLQILATYGYPKLLVEHARIKPGQGVIGAVFQSGVSMCVPDVRAIPGFQYNRPRYRTPSFIAIPIREGRKILGVICVADRRDGQPFTREDQSTLRALAAPVTLAFERELAIDEAQQYAHAAAVDPVSGLFNRRYLHVRLEEELERSRRHQIPLSLLMIDLDDFKLVNDQFGHLAGDAVIKEAALIVRRTVRMFDVCTRYGGEEFAILMPNSSGQSAATVAERIRQRVESHRFADPALATVSLTVSIGLAVSAAQMLPRELIHRADQALYEAKRRGKNRVWTA